MIQKRNSRLEKEESEDSPLRIAADDEEKQTKKEFAFNKTLEEETK